MGNIFEDLDCIWEEWEGEGFDEWGKKEWEEYEARGEIDNLLCHHPLRGHFCNYVLYEHNDGWIEIHEDSQQECPFYKPKYEPSDAEEQVREYLEFTE